MEWRYETYQRQDDQPNFRSNIKVHTLFNNVIATATNAMEKKKVLINGIQNL